MRVVDCTSEASLAALVRSPHNLRLRLRLMLSVEALSQGLNVFSTLIQIFGLIHEADPRAAVQQQTETERERALNE